MSAQQTFYWHDYETFGLNRHIDRPAQFAGLRTGTDFEPIGACDVWYCRPSPDYLPSAEACMVTGITPQEAAEKGMNEADFARSIFERFNTPGTLVVGYNNFRFDDEVTRALFWRNFRDMYAHQFRNGCSRWDLYPFTLAVWALRDEGVVWPEDPRRPGFVTFRLEKLTEANGIVHAHAHDAASDVEATALFAKLLAQKQPRLWRWALENRGKDAVGRAMNSPQPCVWIDPSAGQTAGFMRFPMSVAVSSDNKNELIVWDCRYDPGVLDGMPPEEIRRLAFAPKTERREGEERLPLCRMKINQAPFVCDNLRIITERVKSRFDIDMNAVMENAAKFAQLLPRIQGPVITALELSAEDKKASDDVDAALYEAGFMGELDRDVAAELHRLKPAEIAERVQSGRLHFDDPRLNELLFRMRAHSWPETLSEDERCRWLRHCQKMLSGRLEGRPSLEAYFESIDALMERVTEAHEEGRMSEASFESRSEALDALYNWGEFVAEHAQQ